MLPPLCSAGTINFQVKIAKLEDNSPMLSKPAVDPALTKENAGGRFVLVPPEIWPDVPCAGWSAKIMSVHKGTGVATIKFHDSTKYFDFKKVLLWKPLS